MIANVEPSLAHLCQYDLLELGMLADAARQRAFPERLVTYCLEADDAPRVLCLSGEAPDFEDLKEAAGSEFLLPVCAAGKTAVEYLRFVALCRLACPQAHILLDAKRSGLKVAQAALRFGADDFGTVTDSEEEVRRIIRDAGYVPKRRDRQFRSYAVG